MSEDELRQIRENSERAGLSLNRYARQRILLQPVSCSLPPAFYDLKKNLAGLCNNVNQIAMVINTHTRDPAKKN